MTNPGSIIIATPCGEAVVAVLTGTSRTAPRRGQNILQGAEERR